jgi:hypothetical protein
LRLVFEQTFGYTQYVDQSRNAVITDDVRTWLTGLARVAPVDDADRIAMLRALEELKCAAAGAQARLSRDFEDSQVDVQRAAGVRPRDLGKGIAAQVALARRESPHRRARLLGLARALEESRTPHWRWPAGRSVSGAPPCSPGRRPASRAPTVQSWTPCWRPVPEDWDR